MKEVMPLYFFQTNLNQMKDIQLTDANISHNSLSTTATCEHTYSILSSTSP
jgi:hypothetical protein